MTPVLILSDAYVANGSEPWLVPELARLARIEVRHPEEGHRGETFEPYSRDQRLARPWAVPGTPGLMHRIGGLEKRHITGAISYDPQNHQQMVDLRARKIAGIAKELPPQEIEGPPEGGLLVVGWGGTYGALATAVAEMRRRGHRDVALVHLRYLNPLPADLGHILSRYRRVLVAELNSGQLRARLRAEYLVDAAGLNKTTGRPFTVSELACRMEKELNHK
jgi:2-oxoglutarate ferredoxin oxidoreductase subunit alpha